MSVTIATYKDGYRRAVYEDCVDWYTDNSPTGNIPYCVARFPFVPDYHLCVFVQGPYGHVTEYPMQQFKTLSQALAVLRVLNASTPRNPND